MLNNGEIWIPVNDLQAVVPPQNFALAAKMIDPRFVRTLEKVQSIRGGAAGKEFAQSAVQILLDAGTLTLYPAESPFGRNVTAFLEKYGLTRPPEPSSD